MSRLVYFATVVVLIASISVGNAHICMISPPQRGGYNITGPGNNACFQPNPPCGKEPAGDPSAHVLTAGTGTYVFVQQNLNHYSPGAAGWIDVGFSALSNPTESDFAIVAQIPDVWVGQQWNQRNLSISFQVPNIPTSHGVIRIRYHPNKPTEPIFHQCADVMVVGSSSSLVVPPLFAVVDDIFSDDNTQLMILNGSARPLPLINSPSSLAIRADEREGKNGEATQKDNNHGIESGDVVVLDGLIAMWASNITFVGMELSEWAAGAPPNYLFSYSPSSGSFDSAPLPFSSLPFSYLVALVDSPSPSSDSPRYVVVLTDDSAGQQMEYSYNIYSYAAGQLALVVSSGNIGNSFVNFAGAVSFVDPVSEQLFVYVLAMDENAPTGTHNLLITFIPSLKKTSNVVLQNDVYNIGFLYGGESATSLLSYSPGPWPRNNADWSLVSINTVDGSITQLTSISIPGIKIADNYRGVVRQNALSSNSLTHVFTDEISGTSVATTIDIGSYQIATSVLDLGVNNYRRARNLMAL